MERALCRPSCKSLLVPCDLLTTQLQDVDLNGIYSFLSYVCSRHRMDSSGPQRAQTHSEYLAQRNSIPLLTCHSLLVLLRMRCAVLSWPNNA